MAKFCVTGGWLWEGRPRIICVPNFLGARFSNTGVSFYQTIPPGDLADAIKAKTPNIHFGLYHSLYEWFNPLYLSDKAANFTTNEFVMTKTLPELYELVSTPFPVTPLKRQWPSLNYYTVLSRHTHKSFACSQQTPCRCLRLKCGTIHKFQTCRLHPAYPFHCRWVTHRSLQEYAL